jgi:exosortase
MDHPDTDSGLTGTRVESPPDDHGARPWLLPATALLLALVYAPTVIWLWGRWTMSVWHHAHGMFIPPLVGYFVWQELKGLRDRPPASSAWGFAFLVPALAMHVIDTGLNTQLLSAISIVVAAPGLSLLFLGGERTRAIAFPLAFLAFMLPIPLAVTERLHLALRHVATWGAAHVIPWLGIPVFAESTTLHMASATLEVADACSGFSTLYASLAVAFLTAYTCGSWPRRLLVLAAAAPIAMAANLVRVVLLAVLVNLQGLDVLHTWMHIGSGLLTFVLALPVIFWLGGSGHPQRATT